MERENRVALVFVLLAIRHARGTDKDLDKARALLGELLHTLQDFYSHSNWIEMGKTQINENIGIRENIGRVAAPDQATCTNDGCSKVQSRCVSEGER